ncbi:MAG: hypothetical protein R3C01_18100 [Planctomycetaceae bacterium]
MTLNDLFSRSLGVAHLRQRRLSEYLGNHEWELDLEAGVCDFGKGRVHAVSIIGSESEQTETWRWARANRSIPQHLVCPMPHALEIAEAHDIREFLDPGFSLEIADGHTVSMIVAAHEGFPYYRGPYDGGALFFGLKIDSIQEQPLTAFEVQKSLLETFDTYERFDHRQMVAGFSELLHCPLKDHGQWTTLSIGNELVELTFDKRNRLLALTMP